MNGPKKRIRVNSVLIVILLLTMAGITAAFSWNLYQIHHSDQSKGKTVEKEKVQNELHNDSYAIGNNPTDISRTYFKELNRSLKKPEDPGQIAQSVVKCFITEYYTWTNKDGNYDIGGMQYIYRPKQSDFEKYTLDHFYSDMDLYLTQTGRKQLFQVKDVRVNSVIAAEDYAVETKDEETDGEIHAEKTETPVKTLPCIDVDASWSYEPGSSIRTDTLQNHAVFHVVNDHDRWEIAGIDTQEETQ